MKMTAIAMAVRMACYWIGQAWRDENVPKGKV